MDEGCSGGMKRPATGRTQIRRNSLSFNDIEAILEHDQSSQGDSDSLSAARGVLHYNEQAARTREATMATAFAPDSSVHLTHDTDLSENQGAAPPRWPSSLLNVCQDDAILTGGPSSGSSHGGQSSIHPSPNAHVPTMLPTMGIRSDVMPSTPPGAHAYLHAGTHAAAILPNSVEVDDFEPFPFSTLQRPGMCTVASKTTKPETDTKNPDNATAPLHIMGPADERHGTSSVLARSSIYDEDDVNFVLAKPASDMFQFTSYHASDTSKFPFDYKIASTVPPVCKKRKLDLHERILELDQAMERSQKTQRLLQDWDKKMGLKRSHSKTMRESSASRKMVQEALMHDILRTSLFAPKMA